MIILSIFEQNLSFENAPLSEAPTRIPLFRGEGPGSQKR